jgi:hypothetical protein
MLAFLVTDHGYLMCPMQNIGVSFTPHDLTLIQELLVDAINIRRVLEYPGWDLHPGDLWSAGSTDIEIEKVYGQCAAEAFRTAGI